MTEHEATARPVGYELNGVYVEYNDGESVAPVFTFPPTHSTVCEHVAKAQRKHESIVSILNAHDDMLAALKGIRDCAKGIMPIHSGKPDKELMAVIIKADDARWTRLFAIYSAAEAAIAKGEQ